jgi:hypothetical protein
MVDTKNILEELTTALIKIKENKCRSYCWGYSQAIVDIQERLNDK